MRYYFLFIFLVFQSFLYCDFYFSDVEKERGNKKAKPDIVEENYKLRSKYEVNTNENHLYFDLQGTNILRSRGVLPSQVAEPSKVKSDPFRYTEVSFFITALLSYSYVSLLVFGVNTLENSTIQPSPTGSGRYKTLWASSTVFEITAGVMTGIAVAYDSYQRVFGNKKDDSLSFNIVPYYDPFTKDGGALFRLSYSY